MQGSPKHSNLHNSSTGGVEDVEQAKHDQHEDRLKKYIGGINQIMINEFLAMQMIQPVVLNVLYCICILFKMKPSQDSIKTLFKKKNFLQMLMEFKTSDINDVTHQLLDKYVHKREFDIMEVSRFSFAASIFCEWITEIHRLDAHLLMHKAQTKEGAEQTVMQQRFKKCSEFTQKFPKFMKVGTMKDSTKIESTLTQKGLKS
jgi:hypothetical protein